MNSQECAVRHTKFGRAQNALNRYAASLYIYARFKRLEGGTNVQTRSMLLVK